MIVSNFCLSNEDAHKRRYYFQTRKLEMLKYFRDSLERRIASVNAAITTLETQIERDRQD